MPASVIVPVAAEDEPAAPAVVRIHIGSVVDDDAPMQVRASSNSHDSEEEKLNQPGSGELQPMHSAAAISPSVGAADAAVAPAPQQDPDPVDAGPVHLITIDNFRPKGPLQVQPKPSYTTASFPTVAPIRAGAAAHTHNSTLDTLTSAPTTKRALLKTVPNEVLSLMLTYLDAKSLVQFGLTASAHNSLSCKKALWMALLAQPWSGHDHAGQPIKGVKMETHTKGYYAARRMHALEQRQQKRRDHARALVRVKENHRAWWCLLLTDFCFSPCIGALASIFLICLVWQLVRHEAVGFLTLWPLLAIGALVALVSCTLCCTKYFDMPRGVLPGNFYDSSHGPVKGLMEIVGQGESAWGHGTFCGMSAIIGLFLVFLCLRIEGAIDWNWWVVFSPLYVVFALWCCAPCFRWPATSRIKIEPCVGVWCLLGLPLLAFVILLNVKLADWSSIGFWAVMIPLWTLDLMAFGVALVVSVGDTNCSMLCESWQSEQQRWAASKRSKQRNSASVLIFRCLSLLCAASLLCSRLVVYGRPSGRLQVAADAAIGSRDDYVDLGLCVHSAVSLHCIAASCSLCCVHAELRLTCVNVFPVCAPCCSQISRAADAVLRQSRAGVGHRGRWRHRVGGRARRAAFAAAAGVKANADLLPFFLCSSPHPRICIAAPPSAAAAAVLCRSCLAS